MVQELAVILAMILLTSFNLQGGGGGAAQSIRLLQVGSAFVLGSAATEWAPGRPAQPAAVPGCG